MSKFQLKITHDNKNQEDLKLNENKQAIDADAKLT